MMLISEDIREGCIITVIGIITVINTYYSYNYAIITTYIAPKYQNPKIPS